MVFLTIAAGLIGTFVISLFATQAAKGVSHKLGFLDIPGNRKAHAKATPILGGSAIFVAFLMPFVLGLALANIWAVTGTPGWIPEDIAIHIAGAAERTNQALVLIGCAALLHIMGIVDDKYPLGPWVKLGVQVAAALATVYLANVRVVTFAGDTISTIVTTLWLVGIINSFNFLDNMDGLAAGVASICAAALLAAALIMGQWFVAGLLCLLLGSMLGFLFHNFPPASIFMGDSGSLVIGYLLAVLSCLVTYVRPDESTLIYGLMTPLCLLAVPIYDTFSVMFIRISEGRNPMVGDRRHFSHRLLARGMSKRTAALTIYLCTATTASAAMLLTFVRGHVPAIIIGSQVLMVLLIIALLESTEKGSPRDQEKTQ